MTDQSITLTARQLRELVNPVLPFAGKDDMLPVLCAVHVRTEGKWLIATATDRFRVAVQRVEKVVTDEDPEKAWPQIDALIPTRVIRSVLATFKAARSLDPSMTLSFEDDRMTVEAGGGFDLFASSRFVHYLQAGEFPKIASLIAENLATPDEDRAPAAYFNPTFLSDFKAAAAGHGTALRVRMGAPTKPMVVTNDEGFLGLLMPKRPGVEVEDWSDVFAKSSAKSTAGAA